MNIRLGVILLAVVLLTAYALPAASADCAKQGGQSCGKTEMACGGQCGNCSCEGDCAEGCECGCGGECGQACGDAEGCTMGGDREMRGGRGERPMRHNKMMRFSEERQLQRAVDEAVALCPMQKAHLRHALDFSTEFTSDMMQLYYADHGMSMDELNYRMTRMNHELDRGTREMLTPIQKAVFPKHIWANYSNATWCEGYHPDAHYVLGKMMQQRRRHERMRGGLMQGWWAEERGERGDEESCNNDCPK
jgi:hypothetical protein